MKIPAIIISLFILPYVVFAQEGQIIPDSLVHQDSLRNFLIYVPAAYDGNEPWPLVINLHGADSNPGEQIWLSEMNEIADTANFLVVYPEGIINGEELKGWNDGLKPDILDDVGFIDSMITLIVNNYAIDLSRVYSTGMSNGSGMSLTLGCILSERIAAIGMIAAQGLIEDCMPGRPVPVLYMHGTADLLVPFEGGVGVIPGFPEFIPARDRIQFWIDQNGCIGDPEVMEFEDIDTADSSTVTLERYTDCQEMSEVAFYEIEGGGHTWAGGPPVPPGFEILGNVNLDIHASTEIWNFFSRHQHPNPFIPTDVDIDDAQLLPEGVELYQNFPNPFYGSTRIRYTLDQANHVNFTIYDMLGREVEVIFQQFQSSGQHEITFDASSLAQGVYLYSLDVNGQMLTRKLTVIY